MSESVAEELTELGAMLERSLIELRQSEEHAIKQLHIAMVRRTSSGDDTLTTPLLKKLSRAAYKLVEQLHKSQARKEPGMASEAGERPTSASGSFNQGSFNQGSSRKEEAKSKRRLLLRAKHGVRGVEEPYRDARRCMRMRTCIRAFMSRSHTATREGK